ncbi:hypothetical protein PW5551_09715 [Petrotoga sp. 9PW.55.5.1]|uniref:hypothetical protein n=1 Tax=Petrotoga sp. 9PW.55.5.1 TaxID=1308979 RepID=UPI000DC22C5D|nr:hypothetical protein [Petrotoga sp. 9PW.55.5.1]RAO98445.1 hypothetical protein PW5551_09715 [Petrotoga sp. 9PW.55.5.1]
MLFYNILFSEEGNFKEIKNISYSNEETLIITEVISPLVLKKSKPFLIGYFIVEEDNKDISGIMRHLIIKESLGKRIELNYTDNISNGVREIYGDFVELVSKYIGLRRVISSFNDLILEDEINNNFSFWLEDIVKDVAMDKREILAQRVTKFVNLYLIKVYEGIYKRNIHLLKKYESEITFKILETSMLQKIY